MTCQELECQQPELAAKQTLKVAAQQGARTVANPSLSRQFWTNNRQLLHRRLQCNMHSNTLDCKDSSDVKAWEQACPDVRYEIRLVSRFLTQKAKLEAQKEAASALLAQDNMPTVSMLMDGAKGRFQEEVLQGKLSHQADRASLAVDKRG
jgi:hypothetical protein